MNNKTQIITHAKQQIPTPGYRPFKAQVSGSDWKLINEVIQRATRMFGECSWLGIGTTAGPEGIIIDRIVFPPQENDETASDIDEKGIADVCSKLQPGERILWWGHSHGRMEAFYSSTDWETWDMWMGFSPEYFLGSCHNANGDIAAFASVGGSTFECLPSVFSVEEDENGAVEEALSVMKRKFTHIVSHGYRNDAWDYEGYDDYLLGDDEEEEQTKEPSYETGLSLARLLLANQAVGKMKVEGRNGKTLKVIVKPKNKKSKPTSVATDNRDFKHMCYSGKDGFVIRFDEDACLCLARFLRRHATGFYATCPVGSSPEVTVWRLSAWLKNNINSYRLGGTFS